jgi:hypothetical protein
MGQCSGYGKGSSYGEHIEMKQKKTHRTKATDILVEKRHNIILSGFPHALDTTKK